MTNSKINDGRGWFVLVYKLSSEPSRYRASVWRKLRAAGAVYLQSGVEALPDDPAGKRMMRGVVREIRGVEGTAHLFRGSSVGGQGELEENEEDLAKLEAWVGNRARDRPGAPLCGEAGREIKACRADLELFAAFVYEAADHGSADSS